MVDSFKHKGLRKKMVGQLRERGITDEAVLEAMNEVPRHLFIRDNIFLSHIYDLKAFPIEADQTISHPYTVALQSSLLEIKRGDKILEIGTGSGYQTAVLVAMGIKVYSIERQRKLYGITKPLLSQLRYRAKLVYGDGYAGLPSFAPFDKIIVTAGAPFVPEALKQQLKIGGYLVIPVGEGNSQRMYRYTKLSENEFKEEELGEASFVPLLTDKAK